MLKFEYLDTLGLGGCRVLIPKLPILPKELMGISVGILIWDG
jgi:hypothetical protein